jgi:galactonate dehydratase
MVGGLHFSTDECLHAMKITAIKAYATQGPYTDLCLVKVETDEPGLFGWGEASLPAKCPAVAQAVRDMEPLLVGADPANIEWCWQRMYRHSYWRGGPILTSSISGIDVALWDIRGKVLGEPVYRLLGGAVRDRIALYANIGLSTQPQELRERARGAKARGYRAVKFYPLPAVAPIEFPQVPRDIAACCEAVVDELGEGGGFALDFHGRCSAAFAVQVEAALRHTRPLWIEEPTPPEDVPSLLRCAAQFQTPLAAGERLFTRWGFRELLQHGALAVVQPDASNAGGISEMMRIAAMAETYGVAFSPHNPNGPVQTAASLHLAGAAPAFSMLEYRPELAPDFSAWANGLPEVADGWSALPEGAGLGVEVDESYVAAHRSVADW